MEFNEPLLGIAPKTLSPIYVYLTIRKLYTFIYPLVLKSIHYKTIITFEFIRIY